MKIYFLRHGQTDWNVAHLFQGQTNTDINEVGISQAIEAKKNLPANGVTYDYVVSSPIRRAVHTMEIVTDRTTNEVPTDDRLMEMNFGPLDGTPFEVDAPLANTLFTNPTTYVPPGDAESFEEMNERLGSFLSDMAKNRPGERILAGCHGCAMRGVLVAVGYTDLSLIWEQHLGNCAVIELTYVNDKGEEAKQGEAGHYEVTRIINTQSCAS